jgi:hypothetical protein
MGNRFNIAEIPSGGNRLRPGFKWCQIESDYFLIITMGLNFHRAVSNRLKICIFERFPGQHPGEIKIWIILHTVTPVAIFGTEKYAYTFQNMIVPG